MLVLYMHVLAFQTDDWASDFVGDEELAPAEEVEVASKPSKRQKMEGDAQFFRLKNDKNTTSIPTPFPFPQNYTPSVECALRAKVMPPEVMKKFLAGLARAVYAIKCYPTPSEYEALGVQIIQKYPFLKSPAGCPYVSYMYSTIKLIF